MAGNFASLQLTQSQRLAITPALRQAIELLQLGTVELQNQIDTALAENPLLQADQEFNPVSGETAPEFDSSVQKTGYDDPVGVIAEREAALLSWGSSSRRDDDDESGGEFDTIASHDTLADHLLEQLGCCNADEIVKLLVRWLIGNLDENGFLAEPLADIRADCPISATETDWGTAVNLLRSFDPVGIGAESVLESLILQLRSSSFDVPSREKELAISFLNMGLGELAKRDYKKLSHHFGCTEETVARVFEIISSLDPHPASGFADLSGEGCVVPEIVVIKGQEGWKAVLNPNTIPHVNFDQASFELLTNAKLGKPEYEEWRNKAAAAKNFVHAIEQRFSTIASVAQTIVSSQEEFFEKGPAALKPMGLKDVASTLGIAESTVSRATSGKYMQTPQGTFELKYFFTSALSGADGALVSSAAARKRICEVVAAENPAKPLSDSAIAEILAKEGIMLARRTVAKYREMENIAPKALRKKR